MPLPLPNLDTRRWEDLVDEGRALIPRYAPAWTDHNVHDPGITLIELFAWLSEAAIYRANRVPPRLRRKFLDLIGFAPLPPAPALVVLAPRLVAGAASLTLPGGTTFEAASGPLRVPFRTVTALTAVDLTLSAFHVFDGRQLSERTRHLQDGLAVTLFGADPRAPERNAGAAAAAHAPACYFGFDEALPTGVTVTLFLRFDRAASEWTESRLEREAIAREAAARRAACAPRAPHWSCATPTPAEWCAPAADEPPLRPAVAGDPTASPAHHSARTVWEYHGVGGWAPLDPESGAVADDTRSLTLDGAIQVRVPEAMARTRVGAGAPQYYLRCRLTAGAYDEPPSLRSATLNGVPAEQTAPAWSEMPIAAGVSPAHPPPPLGEVARVDFRVDASGVVRALDFGGTSVDVPEAQLLAYQAATASAAGAITLTLVRLGTGTGFASQHATFAGAHGVRHAVRLWTLEPAGWRWWERRADFDASGPADAHFVLDAERGELAFGDGERGRVVPAGAPIFAAADFMHGTAGSIPAGVTLALADCPVNRALVGDITAARSKLASVVSMGDAAAAGGEDIAHAAGRAAEALWAHERLQEIAAGRDTLDRLDAATVRSAAAPRRAVTPLDFERLARAVPGTRVRRARAWAEVDADHSGHRAPGTVTLVVIPTLPPDRPRPSDGLLRAVRAFIERRRLVGTRLRVVGPAYLEVVARATVRARRGAEPERVRVGVLAALRAFLHPLTGGPEGLGWPFGRDVYRSEILQVLDGAPGVDHVLSLRLADATGRDQCGNLCVPPTWLVASGAHEIEVEVT